MFENRKATTLFLGTKYYDKMSFKFPPNPGNLSWKLFIFSVAHLFKREENQWLSKVMTSYWPAAVSTVALPAVHPSEGLQIMCSKQFYFSRMSHNSPFSNHSYHGALINTACFPLPTATPSCFGSAQINLTYRTIHHFLCSWEAKRVITDKRKRSSTSLFSCLV